jgi:hypothetical protein
MARKSKKDAAIADDEVLNEMRARLKARMDEWRHDPIPAEPQAQMSDAMRKAVTYSGPVPIR